MDGLFAAGTRFLKLALVLTLCVAGTAYGSPGTEFWVVLSAGGIIPRQGEDLSVLVSNPDPVRTACVT
jgi:hypothetical protein